MKQKKASTAGGTNGSGKHNKKTNGKPAAGIAADVVANRPSLGRLSRIAAEIREGNYPNCTQLGKLLGKGRNTIMRDLDTLRDEFGQPIEYDQSKKGFYYTDPSVPFPTVQMAPGEIMSMVAACGALESYGDTTYAPNVRKTVDKIIRQHDPQIRAHYQELQDLLSFRPGQSAGTIAFPLVIPICLAAAACLEIECDYPNSKKNNVLERRRARPLKLLYRGMWYVLSEDADNPGEIRTFALPRMQNYRTTTCKFTRLPGFNAEEYLAHSIGIYSGSNPERVRLRMNDIAARTAGEITWHHSQELITNADGTRELVLNVAITPELEQRVLGWGSGVEVLEPLSLRQTVLAHARAIVERG